MPLSFKLDCDPDVELAIWKTIEESTYFSNKLEIRLKEKSILKNLSIRKLKEWLSSRYLLHLMSGRTQRGEFTKDIHGKPHLEDSEFHISISHSKDLVAVIASMLLVGIDIQYFVAKIHRIKHKFVNEVELENIPKEKTLEALHIIWGAKESLYKAYGKRALDFKKNILISDLNLNSNKGEFYGRIIKGDYQKDFNLSFILFEKFTIVYAKEHN
ncbi:MAG: 4'-phosphopantetheinyl transferase superfamily protein [Bacteroidota bacterium]